MLFANRNGLAYVLDRATGQFLAGSPFVEVNWMSGFDEKGRPIRVALTDGTATKPLNATNWYPASYSPRTGLFYIPAAPQSGDLRSLDGVVMAFDPKTQTKKWEFAAKGMMDRTGMPCRCSPGVLTTATDLLFAGQGRYFYALDARTGQVLWRTAVGGAVQTGAISYSVDGRQFIAVPAGNTLLAFSLPQ
jgi:glucose dehydrogenase